MPWVKIGRYRFDLDDVVLVADVAGDAGEWEGWGVTVTLQAQLAFDLLGSDADAFTVAFDQHVATRTIGKSSPPVAGARVVYPSVRGKPGPADG